MEVYLDIDSLRERLCRVHIHMQIERGEADKRRERGPATCYDDLSLLADGPDRAVWRRQLNSPSGGGPTSRHRMYVPSQAAIFVSSRLVIRPSPPPPPPGQRQRELNHTTATSTREFFPPRIGVDSAVGASGRTDGRTDGRTAFRSRNRPSMVNN